MAHHNDVEFKTLDGLTLRGCLYPASGRGPAIVVTPGVSVLPYYTGKAVARNPVAEWKGYDSSTV